MYDGLPTVCSIYLTCIIQLCINRRKSCYVNDTVPTIVILLIMNMGGILNVGFDKIYLMQNTLNKKTSEVISTYVYTVGIKSSQFSFGSAVGLFTNVINFAFLMLTNWLGKKLTGTGLM